MTQARGPILNPGVYWIDAHPVQPVNFNGWLRRSKGLVKVLRSSLHIDETPPRDWVLFEVLHPAPWTAADAAALGFPTVAPNGKATTEQDTTTVEPAPSFDLSALFAGLQGSGGILLLVALLVLTEKRK